jgi:hypothetical protein
MSTYTVFDDGVEKYDTWCKETPQMGDYVDLDAGGKKLAGVVVARVWECYNGAWTCKIRLMKIP